MIPTTELDYRRNTAMAIKAGIRELLESEAVLLRLTDELHLKANFLRGSVDPIARDDAPALQAISR